MNLQGRSWFRATGTAVVLLTLYTLVGTTRADPIQFSLTGTASDNLYGYTYGQSYTFNWIVNSGFTNNLNSYFSATQNIWAEEYVSQAPIFADVSGDGLTGSWQRPTLAEGDPYSTIYIWNVDSTQRLEFWADNDSGYWTGLQASGMNFYAIDAYGLRIGNIFTFPESYTDPNVYFASYTGTHTVTAGGIQLFPVSGSGGTTMVFNPTSLTISVIPEPSTALLTELGLVALFFRRRQRWQA